MEQASGLVEMISLDQMIRDERAQRPFDPNWCKHLTENWDDRLAGVLVASERENEVYAISDGWHRKSAREALGYTHAACIVFRGLNIEDEARLFTGFNHHRNVRYIDNFFVRVTARETIPLVIIAAIERAGWKPAKQGGDGYICAMQALERIYGMRNEVDKSYKLISDVLRVVTESWGYNADAASGAILEGVGRFLVRYSEDYQIDLRSLTAKLSKYPGGAGGLVGRARSIREAYRSTIPNCVAELVTSVYNVKRTSHRLPDWRR